MKVTERLNVPPYRVEVERPGCLSCITPSPRDDRPTSIVGGVLHDREPIPGERPTTGRYFVEWTDANGHPRGVLQTAWRGTLSLADLDRFRRRVDRDMARYPPI